VLGAALGASAARAAYGFALLFAFALGHCAVIAIAGASTGLAQRYLDWNERSRGVTVPKAICCCCCCCSGRRRSSTPLERPRRELACGRARVPMWRKPRICPLAGHAIPAQFLHKEAPSLRPHKPRQPLWHHHRAAAGGGTQDAHRAGNHVCADGHESEKTMSDERAIWHGIPRDQIPWQPNVDAEACIGCELCYVTCGRGVFEMRDRVAVVERGTSCMVGCSTCAAVCPTEAISFPSRDIIWRLEREHKIFKIVRKEAADKHAKQDARAARAAAEAQVAGIITRMRLEVAGEFGDKRFLVKLEELVEDRPFDIVRLHLEVPTLKGALQKAPSFLSFEVTSTEQEDIQPFLGEVRALIRDNGLVLANETRL
jgi:NAD-dependent dihydropyrimidine dehydrogenase PreA subunit